MDDSDVESEELERDPEYLRKMFFENCLKKRIFFTDRLEKIEKALITMKLISKDVLFCSDYQMNIFTQ